MLKVCIEEKSERMNQWDNEFEIHVTCPDHLVRERNESKIYG